MKPLMNSWRCLLVGVALVGLMVSGCGKNAASVGDSKSKLFATADPAVKAGWDRGIAALKTNDFAVAIVNFQQLLAQPGLTPDQSQAVADTLATANEQMTAAASKGDAKAREAIDELRKMRGR